jgi:hypothetical protein
VGHILAKLGCSNRSQAAVLAGSRRSPAVSRKQLGAKIRTPDA